MGASRRRPAGIVSIRAHWFESPICPVVYPLRLTFSPGTMLLRAIPVKAKVVMHDEQTKSTTIKASIFRYFCSVIAVTAGSQA